MAQRPSEIQVFLTEEISADRHRKIWRAVVLQIPHLVAEGQNREEVIRRLGIVDA